MPHDSTYLIVNDRPVDGLISYDVESDLYVAADAFEFELLKQSVDIRAGDIVEFYVNDRPALRGVVNKAALRGNKRDGFRIALSGTDMMGMLCGHCSATIGDLAGESGGASSIELDYLVRLLISDIPKKYVRGMNDVVFQQGASGLSILFEHVSVSPGQTVFDILRSAASSRGLLFWCDEEGKFIFGKPVSHGSPQFEIIRRSSGDGNNVIDGQRINDIGDGFSKVTVFSQSQSDGDFDANNLSASQSLRVPEEFPFYRLKTVQINGDKNSPELEAKRLINQVRSSLYRYEYLVPGHSQRGVNFRANELAHIDDDELDVHGDFLVYGRKFTGDKTAGEVTMLRLGIPGMVYNA